MNLHFAANASFFGARSDRFSRYQPERTLAEKLDLIASIEGITGVELKYPGDFAGLPEAPSEDAALRTVAQLVAEHGLLVAAVNVDTKAVAHFRHGALSHRDPAVRDVAAQRLRAGMDVAAALGAGIVTTCPLADGYDYPFQIDYLAAWDGFIETTKAAALHRDDVTLVLEYQPHEPHARILLSTIGKMLHVCAEVTAGGEVSNIGANLDVGHAFAAGESPAESAALLARKGWLRYLHANDNTGEGGDWDMISGTVHFWDWLELLYVLTKVGYDGWISGDIQPKHFGPVAAYRTNLLMIRRMAVFLERAGVNRIAALMAEEGRTPELYAYLSELLVTPETWGKGTSQAAG
jgi:xylose isomerase